VDSGIGGGNSASSLGSNGHRVSVIQRMSFSPKKGLRKPSFMSPGKSAINKVVQNVVIVHSGWLDKQGDLFKSWKRRWVVLTSDFCLCYYKDNETADHSGKQPFPSFIVSPVFDVGRPFAFKAYHPGLSIFIVITGID